MPMKSTLSTGKEGQMSQEIGRAKKDENQQQEWIVAQPRRVARSTLSQWRKRSRQIVYIIILLAIKSILSIKLSRHFFFAAS
jgi:hypothetical protein